MKATYRVSSVAIALASVFSPNLAFGQDSKARFVDQYSCKEVMRESGADRDVAIAFLHGFLLGKSGQSAFQLDVLHKQTLDFIERCLDSPNEKALSVLSKIKEQ